MSYIDQLQQKAKRDKKLFKDRKKGLSFRLLGAKYKISPQRAEQIYKRELKRGEK